MSQNRFNTGQPMVKKGTNNIKKQNQGCCSGDQHADHTHDHNHSHEHDHGHCHHHDASALSPAKFRFVTLLNLIITLAEFVGGILSGSLALLSDAVHNLSDTVSIVISYIAHQLSKKQNDTKRTFGYKRAEVLAAFVNSASLMIICVFLIVEAVKRFYHPEPIQGMIMLIVASIGLISNLLSVVMLHTGSKQNMNIRSAYLHMLGDTVSSVAVILGGIAIVFWKIYWLDPVLTILIALYIAKESLSIVKSSSNIFMQGAPELSLEEIKEELEKIEEIVNVHHVHAWMINENTIHFEAHVDIQDRKVSDLKPIYDKIEKILEEKYGVNHITIQFECGMCENQALINHK